ncbi:hypothetical protein M5D96_006797 [Drosophila gunungcola]|uniref:RRM domain-containing protein n=1 Tax=Drosophila gunungcola TaxID=103775 RepID=A0A9P9YPN9_9MUSC|nr:hypothetical protein M5D96_006797 [Drosophila gunungcola]
MVVVVVLVGASPVTTPLGSSTATMKLSKLSNQTNSQDPQAVNSRIFVGNLNTFQCSKTDVERMFQIYGRLAGISMHKGYAFVQFTNPFDARNACHGEDGKTVLSQTLDVNMVAEPKAHQIGRKRQNVSKTGNDWDYFYDSYCSSALLRGSGGVGGGGSNGVRAKKRKRLMTNGSGLAVAVQQQQQQQHGQHHHSAAAVAAAAAAAVHQQQQQVQQQQQQHHQQQQQHQQQVAAVAMAAMANLLPQQQLLLHQQNLLSNAAVATTATAAPGSLHWSQYKQEQQHHPHPHHPHHQQPFAVALAQSPPQQRLPPDYVKGILSLKSSLLANKQSNSGIRFGMRYTPQLENKQHLESPQQEIQVEHVANLRHCPPAHRSLVHSQMPQVKLNRYSQEFPAPHLFQPPFVPLSTRQESPQLEAQDSLDSPPTAEQLELLQQLSDFFGQRQQLQQQVQQQGQSAGCAPDKSVGKELCDAEPPADGCETTREPDKTEEEDSVSVDVKNKPAEETTTTQPKPTVNPKTKTTKPSIAKSTTHKPRTTRTTKSTTKKLPCCTKPLKQSLAKAPNIISFSLNIENDETEESKSLHQQHRSGNPDTLICGNCRESFGELSELLDHKKSYCKLRFTCKCQDVAFAASAKTPPTSAKLLCAVCKDAFANPWDLMVHAQAAHMVNIYELGDDEANSNGNIATAMATVENGHATIAADEAATKQLQMPASSALNKEPNNNNKISNNNNNNNNNSDTTASSNNNGHMSPSGTGIIMASGSVENGTASDMDSNCLDIKFSPSPSPKEVGDMAIHSPGTDSLTIPLQDQHRDDLSLDGRMSSSSQQTHHSDDLNGKLLNGSVSSRGSSPGLEADEPPATRACIVRTLSIEASGPTAAPTANALSLMSNSLSLALAPQ